MVFRNNWHLLVTLTWLINDHQSDNLWFTCLSWYKQTSTLETWHTTIFLCFHWRQSKYKMADRFVAIHMIVPDVLVVYNVIIQSAMVIQDNTLFQQNTWSILNVWCDSLLPVRFGALQSPALISSDFPNNAVASGSVAVSSDDYILLFRRFVIPNIQ